MKLAILLLILCAAYILYHGIKIEVTCELKDSDFQERSRNPRHYQTIGNYCTELIPVGAVSTYVLLTMPVGGWA